MCPWPVVFQYVHDDDVLACALVSRSFRDILWRQQRCVVKHRPLARFRILTCPSALTVTAARLQWVHDWSDGKPGWIASWNEETTATLAKYGGRDALEWAVDTGGCPVKFSTSVNATKGGHLEILQWLLHTGHPLSHTLCEEAAAIGSVKILEWLATEADLSIEPSGMIADTAARAGHKDVVQWIRRRGHSMSYTILNYAAEGGNLELVQWVHNELHRPLSWQTCSAAATGGHVDVLRWLVDNNCKFDVGTIFGEAIKGRHPKVIEYMQSHGHTWPHGATAMAAVSGSLDILQWAHRDGCPCTAMTAWHAAQGGHVEALMWLRENRCEWDEEVCSRAAEYGHLHVLQYAVANDCPWDPEPCLRQARSAGFDEIVDWIRQKVEWLREA